MAYEFPLNKEQEQDIINSLAGTWKRPLFQYWNEYRKYYRAMARSDDTIRNTFDALRFFLLHSNLKAIEDWLEPQKLMDELIDIRDKRNWSAGTFNTYRKSMGSYFGYLLQLRQVTRNPIAENTKPMTGTLKDQPCISSDRVKKVSRFLRGERPGVCLLQRYRDRLFFSLLTVTGARPIELLSLRLSSFSDKRDVLTIQGAKGTGKSRCYPLPIECQDAAFLYISEVTRHGHSRQLEKYLFLSVRGGGVWSYLWVKKVCERLSEALNFKVSSYMFRRHVATALYDSWLDIDKIQHHMWHLRQSTTRRYIEWRPTMNQQWIDILSKYMSDDDDDDDDDLLTTWVPR